MRRLTRALLTVGVLVVATGCAAGNSDDVVTVTSQVAAPPHDSPAASPVPEDPGGTAGSTDDAESGNAGGTADSADTSGQTAGDPSSAESPEPPASEDSTGATGTDETGGSGGSSDASSSQGSSGSGFPIETPTENLPDISRDVAGADKGRPCAADAKYWDEDPTGMRDDVIAAWRNVEKFANADGVIVCLNDGKRSTAQQQAQYDEYAAEYGKDVADQLVLAPENSAHVTGDAMDVQPAAAYQWLGATEGGLGLCRIYDNEPWHFEYDVAYFTDGCPPRLPKPEN